MGGGYLLAYTGGAETESHEEVKSSTGLNPSGVDAATAVLQDSLAEVSTLLHFLFKQQFSELKEREDYDMVPKTRTLDCLLRTKREGSLSFQYVHSTYQQQNISKQLATKLSHRKT